MWENAYLVADLVCVFVSVGMAGVGGEEEKEERKEETKQKRKKKKHCTKIIIAHDTYLCKMIRDMERTKFKNYAGLSLGQGLLFSFDSIISEIFMLLAEGVTALSNIDL